MNYALSHFDNFAMRTTVKSALSMYVKTGTCNTSSVIVIDGGHLLHAVVWPTLFLASMK